MMLHDTHLPAALSQGYVIVTRHGRLFRGRPDADATLASTIREGVVLALASGPVQGTRKIDGYWVID